VNQFITVLFLGIFLAPTTTPQPEDQADRGLLDTPWNIDSSSFNFALVTLDYQTMAVKEAFFAKQNKCSDRRPRLSEREVASRGSAFFSSIGDYWPRHVVAGENETLEIAFEPYSIGQVEVLYMSPADFGGIAFLHSCSGLVLFAASTIYMGRGEHLYPAVNLPRAALEEVSDELPPPTGLQLDFRPIKQMRDEGKRREAWKVASSLNLVHDFARLPYSVFIYRYFRTEGESDPRTAEWWVVLQTD
jgi:hypothetical protein